MDNRCSRLGVEEEFQRLLFGKSPAERRDNPSLSHPFGITVPAVSSGWRSLHLVAFGRLVVGHLVHEPEGVLVAGAFGSQPASAWRVSALTWSSLPSEN